MPSSLQSIILQLQQFWASKGCLITQPYYTQVGAGTMNPATFLRVLGPEPWNIAYVEPSVRPDDGRYGENPNRFLQHTQFQVILKPDPGNPVELYLQSLEAIGIHPPQHDIRLVEDNWEQPAISAWGLGWEIWLDGQEITQFTYFQQVGGQSLDPVAVEITYGLERILISLNNAAAIWDEPWGEGVTYGEVRRQDEFEQSKYSFETAGVTRLRQLYDLYKAAAEACLAQGLVVPAYDYVLKCSHTFNVLDTRGAIGVTERQAFFGQMRAMARRVAETWLEQRKQQEYPLLKQTIDRRPLTTAGSPSIVYGPSSFLMELGVEELPASDLDSALEQLKLFFEQNILKTYSLKYKSVKIFGTPRRLVVYVDGLEPQGEIKFTEVKGPPESACFDKEGKPTQALLGWIKKNELIVPDEFITREYLIQPRDGGRYAVYPKKTEGSTVTILFPRVLPFLLRDIKFEETMRWNSSNVTFSRPIRWLVCMFGETVIPFEYAGLTAGRVTRGLRPDNSPEIEIPAAEKYFEIIRKNGIVLDGEERKALIEAGVRELAASVKGEAILPPELLTEVANLVEKPTPFLGSFEEEFLSLPKDVLISVMMKNQRYFPIQRRDDSHRTRRA
jgi:glycyl-tRNA synthetase